MGQAAEEIVVRSGYARIYQFPNIISSSYERLALPALSKEAVILGSILIVIQLLDGLLTAIGVYHFGISAEGNLMLKALMEQVGYINALVLVKLLAISIIITLCYLSSRVSWLTFALKAVIAIYLAAAIIPWTAIIFTRVL